MNTIYRSEKGKNEILELYNQYWNRLELALEHQTVSTRFGDTHVVVCGPADGEPVLVFHGGNVVSPISFAWLAGLCREFRLYAPDTIGHPGLSAETRLSPKNNEYGLWADDLIDGLNLRQPVVQGTSYGGGILLNLAATAPEKIGKAILMVPAGLTSPPMGPMMSKIVFPMLMYMTTHREKWLRKTVSAMGNHPEEEIFKITGKVFDHVKMEAAMPRNVSSDELKAFTAPTLVLAAENDIYFPARLVLQRARAIIPNLAGAETLAHSGHIIDQELLPGIRERMRLFIREGK